MAAYCFEETQTNFREDIFNGQDLNQLIATAYDNAGNKEKALQFLQKTRLYKLAQELGQKNSQELVIANPIQDNDNISPQIIREAIRHLFLEQQRQNIVQQEQGQRIGALEQEIDKIKKMLSNANIDTIDGINTQIKELEKKDSDLYKYYKHFLSGLRSIYLASCITSSDAVVVNVGHMERTTSIEKGICIVLDMVTAGWFKPFVTGGLSVFHDIADNIYNSRVESKVSEVLKKFYMIVSKQYDESMDFEWHLKQIALFYTELKKDEILNIGSENNKDSFWNFCKQKILPMQNRFFKNKDKGDDHIVKLAFNDIVSLINYIEYNADAMVKEPAPFLAQIGNRAKTELGKTWEEVVKSNPTNIVEYKFSQIENNLSEFNTIIQKMKLGQWASIPLSYISINPWSLYFLKLSWSGEQRGINHFCNKEYYKNECEKKNIPCEEQDLNHFMLLLLYKMCKLNDENTSTLKKEINDKNEKHGSMEIVIDELVGAQAPYEKNIHNFAKKNKDIIELARTKAPQLFVTERNIDLCIEDEKHKKDAKEILQLRSSDQFVESCLKRVCPKLDEYRKAQAEKAKMNIKYEPIGMDLMTFEILKHDEVSNLGDAKG